VFPVLHDLKCIWS